MRILAVARRLYRSAAHGDREALVMGMKLAAGELLGHQPSQLAGRSEGVPVAADGDVVCAERSCQKEVEPFRRKAPELMVLGATHADVRHSYQELSGQVLVS